MLNAGWMRRLKPGNPQLLVVGDSDTALQLARGGAEAGFRVSSRDVNYLRRLTSAQADGLILDCGDESKTLDEARRCGGGFWRLKPQRQLLTQADIRSGR